MKSAITISLVEEARKGPFVYHDGLADGCARAAAAGFDAVEIFVPSFDPLPELAGLLEQHSLKLAAIGTGAGWVKHKLSLTDGDPDKRAKAIGYVKGVIDLAAEYGAPAIIGSMQGKSGEGTTHEQAIGYLKETLNALGPYAKEKGQPLFYEPLNRYETNLFNTLTEGVEVLESLATDNVKLLADLFHMNIEEADIAQAVLGAGTHVGHVHFVDSNRRAAGLGHMDHGPIVEALKAIGYDGYLCAEAFPLPDADTCAKTTIETIKKLV
ncbi:MAG: sugar phosphate isomerase/epimerase [Phycisphaeraceae bacterium]|nr:sugar phosphate isomerase/epimerase [Phycisphaeraceae bacterium]